MKFYPKARLVIICLCLMATIQTYAFAQSSVEDNPSHSSDDNDNKIQGIFDRIGSIGNGYNAGGGSAAKDIAFDTGCRAAVEGFLRTQLFADVKDEFLPSESSIPDIAQQYLNTKSQQLGTTAFSNFCAALQGSSVGNSDLPGSLKETLQTDLISGLAMFGQGLAHGSGLPFLSRLEVQTGVGHGGIINSVTSVQPLWKDPSEQHHVFGQVSYYSAPDDKTDLGYNKQYDTYNAGVAYRYLTDDQNYLYGANVFFDHAPKMNHNRMSVGVDARTSQLAASANRYFPISDWRQLDSYYEEKAAAGWDLQLRGQVPQLPSWTASAKAYQWDEQDDGDDLYGFVNSIEYSPVPALAVSMGLRDESQEAPTLEAALRFTYRFDQPQDIQFRQKTELAPVSDYVYEKVQRENIIRVKQQRRPESKLSVIQTIGANTAAEDTGTTSLSSGQSLLMPVTVSVANSVGAVARLRFADGSILTIAQNSSATIIPNQITLISGTIQYVNNGAVQTIVVPGGTITLHGTDLDLVSNGANTSVRVRDGAVDFVGSSSGSASLGPEDAAQSIAGVVGTLAFGSGGYVTHSDTISTQIDRVASPIEGEEVTPYPYEAPRVISSNMTIGGEIIFGLRFNDAVTVSAGTPRLLFTINGNNRTANYVSGSGTDDLMFSYTNVGADISATTLTVTSLDKNGASITGNGKNAVTTIADAVLSVTGTGDSTAPSGYSVAYTTDPVNDGNVTTGAFTISSAEVGTTFNYVISSSGGGTNVTGSGSIATASQSVIGINLSGLGDGTLTLSLTLTDASFNTGTAATDTVLKNTSAPSGYTVAFTTDPVNIANASAAAISIANAEVGATYSYTVTDGTTTLGPFTGAVASATQAITGIDLSTLTDTTLTVSVTLTDTGNNAGVVATDTVLKDVVAPTITSVTPPADGTYEP